ncbi:hypothetical protein [Aneurinibacillus danicus]|jgi:hypothetical protein|uniref:Uncharacterized protein n=1 Tax=Aneurinibacillus danicus TaxID=267746 RepID=A0A511V6D5_9BACL|nr:hypothetical protein [Aneurinibacillus danicus]GEN34486.1 hypothetical protein ADA01nite_19460 [Aneurinibacillus danicus]
MGGALSKKRIIEPASGDKHVSSYKLGKEYEDLTLHDLGYTE